MFLKEIEIYALRRDYIRKLNLRGTKKVKVWILVHKPHSMPCVRWEKKTACLLYLLARNFFWPGVPLISSEMSRIISLPCLHEIWCSRCLISQVDGWQIWENNFHTVCLCYFLVDSRFWRVSWVFYCKVQNRSGWTDADEQTKMPCSWWGRIR